MKLHETIGKTPLVELNWDPEADPRVSPGAQISPAVRLFGKLEGNNPAGSVKDRPARSMIERAEERGELRPGITLLEPTSGNTGIALAMMAAARGYPIELVMPENATEERVRMMRAYGATVTLTPAKDGMEGAIDHARAKAATGRYLMLDQFSNPDNPLAHYETTGPEIWEATEGKVTHFVSAMGTTGTIMGVSRYLKEQNPNVRIIGVQPDGDSYIPGIRRWPKEYLPKIFEPERVDLVVDVSQADAEAEAVRLAAQDAVFVGPSSSGATLAARRLCRTLEHGLVVCILCDRGDRYLSTPLFGGA